MALWLAVWLTALASAAVFSSGAAAAQYVYRLRADRLITSGCYTGVTVTDHEADRGFTVTATGEGVRDSVGAYFVIDAPTLAAMPYLVIEVDPEGCTGLSVNFYGWGAAGLYSTGNLTADSGRLAVHLGAFCSDYTCQLWCYGAAGQAFSVRDCYLTSCNPGVAEFDGKALAVLSTAVNQGNTVRGDGGCGLSLSGGGYTYWRIEESLLQTYPYLVYRFRQVPAQADAFGVAFGTWWNRYQALPLDGELHAVDLRAFSGYEGDGALLQLWFNGVPQTEFSCMVLAADPAFDPDAVTVPDPPEPCETFDVDFDAADGTPVPAQAVPAGGLAEPPASLREGYEADWYTADGRLFCFETDPVTQDMTLYARWHAVGLFSRIYAQRQIQGDAVRLVAALDGLAYEEVGFAVRYDTDSRAVWPEPDSPLCSLLRTDTVWGCVYADGVPVPAQDLGGACVYALTLPAPPDVPPEQALYLHAYAYAVCGEQVFCSAVQTFAVGVWGADP